MSLKTLCQPRSSVFAKDRRVTVLSLDTFLKGTTNGKDFFEENYFTVGMTTLVERAFKHLSGNQAGSSVFLLSQAMGGGKTHGMIALGLLARDPELRRSVMGSNNPAPNLGKCQVVGFNGRNSDAAGGIWGSLATQLGRADQFSQYTQHLQAPGPEAWKQLLSGTPLIIFLDELPPYLEYAAAKAVGNSDLAVVTTTALANLFVAVADMDNVCVVLSDLAGTSYSIGENRLQGAFDRATQSITNEARRIALNITPVNPNGDELYHILRKRIFEKVASDADREAVARAYQKALEEAVKMGLTSTLPEKLYTGTLESYPFHTDFRSLLGKFKENEGFQQTRGVIRLMQMLVSNLWLEGKADHIDLIHPYDIDLNNDELASEIRTINPTLSEAIANDVASGGQAEVEQIDLTNGNSDASDSAKLVLLASLSTTPGAIHGLREHELVDCLQRPGRNLSTFKANVLDKLATRAWYLHASADGRLYFKNQQNLAAKLRSTALSLHAEVVDRMLRNRLTEAFTPTMRDCYQHCEIIPPPDSVKVEVEKTTLVIVRPGGNANQLPISSEWQDWWAQQDYKNRVLFLSGTRDTYQKLVDAARNSQALASIENDLVSQNLPSNDPQLSALGALKDRIGLQFNSALKEAFDQVVFPSINNKLRSAGIELAFPGNQNPEATIRATLDAAQKFTAQISDDSFYKKAEARLFGSSEAKVVLWSDFKRNAAVNTNWPFHKPSALDELKAACVLKGLWKVEGSHVRRGPFAAPDPQVELRELSVADKDRGEAYLKIEPLHATRLVFETGDTDPTAASSPVPTPASFQATALRYRFLALDPDNPNRVSAVREWTAKLRLKHELHKCSDHYEVELLALPVAAGIVIRYTTDGSAPTSAAAATYESRFRVPANSRVVCAQATAPAFGIASEVTRIKIPVKNDPITDDPVINPVLPAKWTRLTKLDDAGAVWIFIQQLEKTPLVTAEAISLTVESADGHQVLEYTGSGPYQGVALKTLTEKLQELVGTGGVRLGVGSVSFPTGQALLDWLHLRNLSIDINAVVQ